MPHRKRRDSYSLLATITRRLVLLLGIGTALAALLRAIDPQWLDLLVRLVRRIPMLLGSSAGWLLRLAVLRSG
jgi:hypothetical protein